jgi:type III secretion protein D
VSDDSANDGSSVTTRLRVLSGEHAGADLRWLGQTLRIGGSEDLDVYIGDWSAPTIELHRDAAGGCQARWLAQEATEQMPAATRDGDWYGCLLQPWVPLRFGAVVLCIGPADEAWPDDVDLLQRHFSPPFEGVPEVENLGPPAARRWAAVVSIATFVVLALAASAVMLPAGRTQPAPQGAVAPAVPALQELRDALGPRLAGTLGLTAQGPGFLVQGVVDTRADLAEVGRLLDRLPASMQVARHYTAAPDVVDMVKAVMPGADVSVERTAPRRFEVKGRGTDLVAVQGLIERLGRDLQAVGVELVAAAADPAKPSATPTSVSGMLIDSGGVSFSRTRDGAKHIVVQSGAAKASQPTDARVSP